MSQTAIHAHPSPLQRLADLMQSERADLWTVVAYSLAIGLLTLALPIATQSLINTVAFGTVLQPLVVLSILLLAALIAASVLQTLRQWLVEVLQRRLFVRLSAQVGERLLRVQSWFFDRVNGPELVNRFLDVVTVQKSVAVLLIDGLTISMQTTVGLLLLAVYHPLLLVFDVVLFAMILFILFGLGRGAVRTSVAESHAKYEMVAWLEELARHRGAFRTNDGAAFARSRIDELAQNYVAKRSAHFRIELRQIVGSLTLQAFAMSALLGFGGYLVMQGQLTLGQLIAGELVVSTVVNGFTKLNKSLESFYDLMAAVDKLGYLQDLPMERGSGRSVTDLQQPSALQISGLRFSFDQDRELLRGLNLAVEPGDKVGITGRFGSGKSTLLDLISSMRQPQAGHLELDGLDYRELQLKSLRTQVVLVRRVEVFAGTLLENLTLGAHVDMKEVREALEKTGMQSMVSALPNALQTMLSSDGVPLTHSQALRLMVARALLTRPRLLLLDGVLDGIEDLRQNGPLLKTLFAPDAPWTLILSSDRVDLLARCNRVYRLADGEFVAMDINTLAVAEVKA